MDCSLDLSHFPSSYIHILNTTYLLTHMQHYHTLGNKFPPTGWRASASYESLNAPRPTPDSHRWAASFDSGMIIVFTTPPTYLAVSLTCPITTKLYWSWHSLFADTYDGPTNVTMTTEGQVQLSAFFYLAWFSTWLDSWGSKWL